MILKLMNGRVKLGWSGLEWDLDVKWNVEVGELNKAMSILEANLKCS